MNEGEWDDGEKLGEQANADAVATETPSPSPAGAESNPAPAGATPEPAKEPEPAEEAMEIPGDFKGCLALLKKLEQLPESTPAQEKIKEGKLKLVKEAFARIQQGLPVIHLSADDHATSQKGHAEILRNTRLEHMARQEPLIRSVLEELKSSKKQVASLTAQLKQQKNNRR